MTEQCSIAGAAAAAEAAVVAVVFYCFSAKHSRAQSSCEKSIYQRSDESRRFPSWVLRFPPAGKARGRLGNTGPHKLAHAAVETLSLWLRWLPTVIV